MTQLKLDSYEYAFHDDPYPRGREVREKDPVHVVQDHGFWLPKT